ncbi:hypothetical protein NP493_404g00033 [Ridgeia piscesae]|uniref:Uncharacterized protein n=1 Tax=Ridgeia piscesae TaxID=27915 RepID=A0AAD9L0Z5_RIDPI|nr:hypothetical protein NP493_404g00033 [Ridgeia piscesae]
MKQLYKITRKLAGKYKRTDRPIKDKNGNVLTSDEDQLKRWREHFEELLNRPPPQNPPDITPAEEVLQINCERPSKPEIEKAIHHMKRGKASGPDKILAEAIKADIETSTEILHDLLGKIWEQEEIPTEWKEGSCEERSHTLARCERYTTTRYSDRSSAHVLPQPSVSGRYRAGGRRFRKIKHVRSSRLAHDALKSPRNGPRTPRRLAHDALKTLAFLMRRERVVRESSRCAGYLKLRKYVNRNPNYRFYPQHNFPAEHAQSCASFSLVGLSWDD